MRALNTLLVGILLGLLGVPQALGVVVVVVQPAGGGGGGPTYLLQENFEGAGYEQSWTEDQGDPDPDYSTSGLGMEGSDCLLLGGATNNADQRAWVAFTPTGGQPQELYFLMRIPTITVTSDRILVLLTTSGGGSLGILYIDSGARLSVIASGGTLVDTVATVSAATTYHVWVKYLKGSGANAQLTVGFSTDGTRPTSGDNYAQSTNGTSTTDCARIYPTGDFGTNTTNEVDLIIDKIRIDDATIGDNPS